MKEEFNPYLIFQKIVNQLTNKMGEDWIEIRKGTTEGQYFLYFIEDTLMQGGRVENCELPCFFKIDQFEGSPEDGEIECYMRFIFHSITPDIDIAEFYRQYKDNVLYYNKHYSNRYKLPIMSENIFKRMYPEICKNKIPQSNLLLLV